MKTKPYNLRVREKVVKLRSHGVKASTIKKKTGVSARSQRRYAARIRHQESLEAKTPNKKGAPGPHSKVTEAIKKDITEERGKKRERSDRERQADIEQRFGERLSIPTISRIRKRARVTKKKSSTREAEQRKKHVWEKKRKRRKSHHPKTGNISIEACAATDEGGLWSNERKKWVYSRVRQRRVKHRNVRLSGRSYRDNRSRVSLWKRRHPSFTVHLALTVCLNEDKPVAGFHISDEYFDSRNFLSYVKKRKMPPGVTHDLIDNYSTHTAVKTLRQRGLPTIAETYDRKKVVQDFVPPYSPNWNPAEQALSFVIGRVTQRSSRFMKGGEWQKEDLKRELKKAVLSITHEHVKAWYRGCFSVWYPR
jgi:hypothetical protein